ncbi:unnamed protein product, partial [Pylaiella littoralis]
MATTVPRSVIHICSTVTDMQHCFVGTRLWAQGSQRETHACELRSSLVVAKCRSSHGTGTCFFSDTILYWESAEIGTSAVINVKWFQLYAFDSAYFIAFHRACLIRPARKRSCRCLLPLPHMPAP